MGLQTGVTFWKKWGYRSGVIGVQITEGGNYTFFAVNCEKTTPLPTKFLCGYTLLYIVYRGLVGLPALAGGGGDTPGVPLGSLGVYEGERLWTAGEEGMMRQRWGRPEERDGDYPALGMGAPRVPRCKPGVQGWMRGDDAGAPSPVL